LESKEGSTDGETYETDPIYFVEYEKTRSTEGHKGITANGDERYSIVDMNINIKPKSSFI